MAWIIYICFGLFSSISTICAVHGTGVAIGCYSSTVQIYNGHQQTTKDGTPCVRWDSVNKGYTKSQFPDPTLSDAANYCRAMDKKFLWCWKNSSEWDRCGIRKCGDIDVVTKCGSLKIEQPALLGRNVTFSFTPDSHDPNAILEWQRAKKNNPWYTRPLNYKFTQFYENGIYYMILTDSIAYNDEAVYRIHYYNQSTQCLMETDTKLILKDSPRNPCGFVYLRSKRVVEDDDIRLEYYPSETADISQHKWIRFRNEHESEIRLGDDIYKEDQRENGIFELTIQMIKQNMSGSYGVRCGTGDEVTEKVMVIVLVPPSAPEFRDLQDIDGCKECIVSYSMERIEVHCETSGGTQPITAKVTIGDESFTALQNDKDTSVYIAFIPISSDRHHNSTITCSIMNVALSLPLTTSTKLYVIKPPTVVLALPDEIKERSSDNITCIASSSRPAPKVYFDISGTEVKSAINHTIHTIILETIKRDWNGKNVSCCRSNRWFKPPIKCSEPKMINLLFPPSSNKLEIKFDPEDPLQMYAVCMVYNSNPICMVKFTSTSGIIGSEKNSRNFSLPHGAWNSAYTVNLNVRKEDNGTNIACVVICEDFDSLDLRDTSTIVIPYRSEIRFNILGSTLNISKGEETHVKCLADSFPASNITWTEELDEEDIIMQQCKFKPECVLDINTGVISKRRFVCAIQYLQIRDNKTLTVNVNIPGKQKQLSDSSDSINGTLIGIITGACSALVLIIVILAMLIRKKRRNVKAKPETDQTDHSNNSLRARGNKKEYDHQNENVDTADPMDVIYSKPIKNKKVSAEQEDATYSVVNKAEKSRNQAATCTAKGQPLEDGQLTYVELDFDQIKSAPTRAIANRRDSPTEYVDIDFVKTAANVGYQDDTQENENIYANQ